MNQGILMAVANLGMSFETIILVLLLLGCLVFFAKDVRLGLVMIFVLSGLLFMWFYSTGLDYVPSLVVFFMDLIILSFTLYGSSKRSSVGGFI